MDFPVVPAGILLDFFQKFRRNFRDFLQGSRWILGVFLNLLRRILWKPLEFPWTSSRNSSERAPWIPLNIPEIHLELFHGFFWTFFKIASHAHPPGFPPGIFLNLLQRLPFTSFRNSSELLSRISLDFLQVSPRDSPELPPKIPRVFFTDSSELCPPISLDFPWTLSKDSGFQNRFKTFNNFQGVFGYFHEGFVGISDETLGRTAVKT